MTIQILFFFYTSPLFLGMFCAVPDPAGPPSPNGHRDQHDGHHYLGHWQGGETQTWNKQFSSSLGRYCNFCGFNSGVCWGNFCFIKKLPREILRLFQVWGDKQWTKIQTLIGFVNKIVLYDFSFFLCLPWSSFMTSCCHTSNTNYQKKKFNS